jgi:hypothetical protein
MISLLHTPSLLLLLLLLLLSMYLSLVETVLALPHALVGVINLRERCTSLTETDTRDWTRLLNIPVTGASFVVAIGNGVRFPVPAQCLFAFTEVQGMMTCGHPQLAFVHSVT